MKCYISYLDLTDFEHKLSVYTSDKRAIYDVLSALGKSDCTLVNVSILEDKKEENK